MISFKGLMGSGIFLMTLVFAGCSRSPIPSRLEVTATAYCSCEKCCDWVRGPNGQPVWATGPDKGKPKKVGMTSMGTKAHRGTVAADKHLYPLGTRLWVAGYGHAIVEDVGGGIKGNHIDLWFPTHKEALEWGSRTVTVELIAEP